LKNWVLIGYAEEHPSKLVEDPSLGALKTAADLADTEKWKKVFDIYKTMDLAER